MMHSPIAAAAPAIDPELAKRIDEHQEALRAATHYHDTVYLPALEAFYAKRDAGLAEVPHHRTERSFDNMFGQRIHLTTESGPSVLMARKILADRTIANAPDEYYDCLAELVEAADRRDAAVAKIVEADPNVDAMARKSDDMANLSYDFVQAVAEYPVRTIADLVAKLEYVREILGDEIAISEILSDLRRIASAA